MICVVLPVPASYSPRKVIKANIQAAGRLYKSRFQSNQNGVCGDGYRNVGNSEDATDHLFFFLSTLPTSKSRVSSALRILTISRQGQWLEGPERQRQELKHQRAMDGVENELGKGIR